MVTEQKGTFHQNSNLKDNSEGCIVSYYYWARNCYFYKG